MVKYVLVGVNYNINSLKLTPPHQWGFLFYIVFIIMKLNESDIKRIIKEVISEGSFNTLRRKEGWKITEMDIFATIINEIVDQLQVQDYDVDDYNGLGSPIPEYIKPYLDDVADVLNKNDFQMIIWDRIINEVADDDDIFRIVEKIQNDLDQNS